MLNLLPTTRLKFVVVDHEMKKLISTEIKAFSQKYGLAIPDGWPKFPEAFRVADSAMNNKEPWTGYLFLDFKGTKVIGNGGFVNEPDENGAVEIGYEIAPEYQNLGYATEAATEMLSFALSSGASAIIAHTLPVKNASNSVLKKIGLEFEAEIDDEDLGKIWQWKIEV